MQYFLKSSKIFHKKRRMGFPSRVEITLDAKMYLPMTEGEPNSAARLKVLRLPDLSHAEVAAIESSRDRFLPFWHCDLDVIDVLQHGVTQDGERCRLSWPV